MSGAPVLQAAATQRLALFPTYVWQTRFTPEVARLLNTGMLRALDALRAPLPPLVPGNTFQSEHDLHRHEAFRGFVTLVESVLEGVLDYLGVEPRPMMITGCWANVGAPGATHMAHTHPNNFLSGVYYVRAPEGANRITFDDPRPQTLVISPPMRSATLENSSYMNVTVAEGSLLVFPAWLQHHVPANRSPEERVSVSFNAMFRGYTEMLAGSGGTEVTRYRGGVTD